MKPRITLLIVSIFLFCASSISQVYEPCYWIQMRNAERYFQKGEYKKSWDVYKTFLQNNNISILPVHLPTLAFLYLEKRDSASAIQTINLCIENGLTYEYLVGLSSFKKYFKFFNSTTSIDQLRSKNKDYSNHPLGNKIAELHDIDSYVQNKFSNNGGYNLFLTLQKVDSLIYEDLDSLITKNQFFSIQEIGIDNYKKLLYLIINTAGVWSNPKEFTEKLKTYISNGKLSPEDYAYIVDYHASMTRSPLVYGQYNINSRSKVLDLANIDSRRNIIGLEPLVEYCTLKKLNPPVDYNLDVNIPICK